MALTILSSVTSAERRNMEDKNYNCNGSALQFRTGYLGRAHTTLNYYVGELTWLTYGEALVLSSLKVQTRHLSGQCATCTAHPLRFRNPLHTACCSGTE